MYWTKTDFFFLHLFQELREEMPSVLADAFCVLGKPAYYQILFLSFTFFIVSKYIIL